MKTLLALFLSLYLSTANAIGEDKIQHFVGSAALTGISYIVTGDIEQSVKIAAYIGILKEVFDAVRPNGSGFDVKDLAADAAGISSVVLPIFLYQHSF